MKFRLVLLLVLLTTVGCHKKVATAPVPGSINAFDAYAFRSLADAQAAIHSVKIWKKCSDLGFPATVLVDGTSGICDSKAGEFPPGDTEYLNTAINAYNLAQAAGHGYHSGATQDATGLKTALIQLGTDITTMLAKVGGK